LTIKTTKEKKTKLGQNGPKGVTWPTSEILEQLLYLGNGWS